MKKLQNLAIGILALVPVFYVGGYFAFLVWTKPMFQKQFTPFADSISVTTKGRPVAKMGVKFFKPAMATHARLSGTKISVSAHEFS